MCSNGGTAGGIGLLVYHGGKRDSVKARRFSGNPLSSSMSNIKVKIITTKNKRQSVLDFLEMKIWVTPTSKEFQQADVSTGFRGNTKRAEENGGLKYELWPCEQTETKTTVILHIFYWLVTSVWLFLFSNHFLCFSPSCFYFYTEIVGSCMSFLGLL